MAMFLFTWVAVQPPIPSQLNVKALEKIRALRSRG
jgi:hypothetical protein